MSASRLLHRFFDVNNIKYVFGNPGTTETSILSSLSKYKAVNNEFEYILTLQESTTIGIAAGYALKTNKPSIINIHTFPGLANSICNMYNALLSQIPLVVIAGQQNTNNLIHNPSLSGPLVQLSQVASKYSYEITNINEFDIALQRCYLQSQMHPFGPTFLSIPMNILTDDIDAIYDNSNDNNFIYKSNINQDITNNNLGTLIDILDENRNKNIAIISDHEVNKSNAIDIMHIFGKYIGADIFGISLNSVGTVNVNCDNFIGELPGNTDEIHGILEKYDVIIILGEMIKTFLFRKNLYCIPHNKMLIQISANSNQLSFDYPMHLNIFGNIRNVLSDYMKIKFNINDSICFNEIVNVNTMNINERKHLLINEMKTKNKLNVTNEIIIEILSLFCAESTDIIMEGSNEQNSINYAAMKLGFNNRYCARRGGGGLGWAMPLAVGLAMDNNNISLCFIGDGSSLYALHCIWTAAKYKIKCIFICFVNNEYRLLKSLWKNMDNNHQFIGDFMDLNQPNIDYGMIAQGFGANVMSISNVNDCQAVIPQASSFDGPSFIILNS